MIPNRQVTLPKNVLLLSLGFKFSRVCAYGSTLHSLSTYKSLGVFHSRPRSSWLFADRYTQIKLLIDLAIFGGTFLRGVFASCVRLDL